MSKKLARFNPAKLALYERSNYVYYYRRQWLRLLIVSILMVKEAFQLSFFQAVVGAYWIARAEIAFAPHPDNNLPLAKAYLRRFYAFLSKKYHLNLNVDQTAECELNWWIVHRRLFAVEQNQELADALASLLTLVYGTDPQAAQHVGAYRAEGMLRSDQWVRQGMDPRSPLLEQAEALLRQGYELLKASIT